MEQNNRISDGLLERIKTFVDVCIDSRVYKKGGKVFIITEKETIDVLNQIKKMIGDGYEGQNR